MKHGLQLLIFYQQLSSLYFVQTVSIFTYTQSNSSVHSVEWPLEALLDCISLFLSHQIRRLTKKIFKHFKLAQVVCAVAAFC